jgi:hypothetical protein
MAIRATKMNPVLQDGFHRIRVKRRKNEQLSCFKANVSVAFKNINLPGKLSCVDMCPTIPYYFY